MWDQPKSEKVRWAGKNYIGQETNHELNTHALYPST